MTKDEVTKLRMNSPESLQFLNNATKFYNLMMMMLSRLVDTFFSRTSWTMLLYAENHSISVA